MIEISRKTQEWPTPDRGVFQNEIVPACRPAILRGALKSWPVVVEGGTSARAMRDYLAPFDIGKKVETFVGPASIKGRFFYDEEMRGFNFERRLESFSGFFDAIIACVDRPDPPSIYLGSATLPDHLPGFAAQNRIDLVDESVTARIWLGNAATVSTHFDLMDNLACVIAGRRRFILFPPEQISNLYVGPIDNTLAGQPVSMASVRDPDFDRQPRFRAALAAAEIAELEAGDALYLPKLWWHNVESLAPFNGLVNYWWDRSRLGPESAFTTLLHGLLTIAELPDSERFWWKAFFDHFIFRLDGHPLAHLDESQRGVLGKLTPERYRKLRAHILKVMRS